MRSSTVGLVVLLSLLLNSLAWGQCPPSGGYTSWSSSNPNWQGHTVPANTVEYVDVSNGTFTGPLIIQGTLIFACDMPISIQCPRIEVANGGILQIGTASNPAVGPVVITLTGSTTSGNSPERTLDVLSGGTIELHGASNGNTVCWTSISNPTGVGENVLVIDLTAPMNWVHDDKLVVADTDFPTVQSNQHIVHKTEVVTVDYMNDNKVALQGQTLYAHHGQWVQSSIDERAEVGLLNRSICIQGTTGAPGQVRFRRTGTDVTTVHIEWTEFTQLGSTALQAGGSGGYPIHFHEMGNMVGAYIKHCSSHHHFRNNVVIHNTSGLLVEDNVLYDTIGYHVWFEEETPTCKNNIIKNNLALVTQEDQTVVQDPIELNDGDLGHTACFYLRNLDNIIEGNHAASSEGSGFYVTTIEKVSLTRWAWAKYHTVGTFKDNLAHSCADSGFYLGGFTEFPPGYPGAATSFDHFTAYKNGAWTIFCRNYGSCKWVAPQLADSGLGVYMASRGFLDEEFQATSLVVGGKIVGESTTNLGSKDNPREIEFGRGLAEARGVQTYMYGHDPNTHYPGYRAIPGRRELIGVSIYDGIVLLDSMSFSGFGANFSFQPLPSYPAFTRYTGAIGPAMYDNPWSIDPRNSIKGCAFGGIGANQKVHVRPYTTNTFQPQAGVYRLPAGTNNTTIRDIDGSLSGAPATLVPKDNPVLAQRSPTNPPIVDNMAYYSGPTPYGAVMFYEGDGAGPVIALQKLINLKYNGVKQPSFQEALDVPWSTGSRLALNAWNTVISLPSNGVPVPPTLLNEIEIEPPGPNIPVGYELKVPMIIVLYGNEEKSLADFSITLNNPGSPIKCRVGKSFTIVTTAGTPLLAADASSSWPSVTDNCWTYDASTQKLKVRLRIPSKPTVATPYVTNWGSVFDGGTVFMRFSL